MRRALLVLGIAMALVASACGGSDDGGGSTAAPTTQASSGGGSAGTGPGTPAPQPLAQRTSVTVVPVVATEAFAPAFLADYFGEFEKENLDVTLTQIPTNDSFVALARGDIELQVGGMGAGFFNLLKNGTDLRWVANVVNGQSPQSNEGLWVRNDLLVNGDVPDADVKGMSIALGLAGVASTSALPVSKWLGEHGATLNDVQIQSIGGNEVLIALEQGSIDAGYVLTPQWAVIEKTGCCTLVTPKPPMVGATYTMTTKFMDEQPDVARALIRALMRTVRTYLQGDYHADPKVVDALVATLGATKEAITAMPSLTFDPDMPFDDAQLQEIQQVWIDAGVLQFPQPMTRDEVVDSTLVEEVLAGR